MNLRCLTVAKCRAPHLQKPPCSADVSDIKRPHSEGAPERLGVIGRQVADCVPDLCVHDSARRGYRLEAGDAIDPHVVGGRSGEPIEHRVLGA